MINNLIKVLLIIFSSVFIIVACNVGVGDGAVDDDDDNDNKNDDDDVIIVVVDDDDDEDVIIVVIDDDIAADDDDDDIADDDDDYQNDAGELGEPCMNSLPECAGELICVRGICLEKQCNTDADCTAGMICADYQCVPIDDDIDDIDDCEMDSQCGDGFICEDGVCVEDIYGCSSDGDCALTPNTPKCNMTTGECVECLGDNDCHIDMICLNNRCLWEDEHENPDYDDCPPGQECCEIGGGSVCLDPGCQTIPGTVQECDADNLCPLGQVAIGDLDENGEEFCICLIKCPADDYNGRQPCSTSSDCRDFDYPVCDSFGSGLCVECLGDFDCGESEHCNDNLDICVSNAGDDDSAGSECDAVPGTTCQEVQGYGFCLDSNGQPPASTSACDLQNPSCPETGQMPVQAQDGSGSYVCICLYECTPDDDYVDDDDSGCEPCLSDADCPLGQVCTDIGGLIDYSVCGTGDMMTDAGKCIMDNYP